MSYFSSSDIELRQAVFADESLPPIQFHCLTGCLAASYSGASVNCRVDCLAGEASQST